MPLLLLLIGYAYHQFLVQGNNCQMKELVNIIMDYCVGQNTKIGSGTKCECGTSWWQINRLGFIGRRDLLETKKWFSVKE